MTDRQKVAHLSHLLGEGADVVAFARTYAQHYDQDSPAKQRADALRLFGGEAEGPTESAAPSSTSFLRTARADFDRIWNSDAPALCRTCGHALVGDYPHREAALRHVRPRRILAAETPRWASADRLVGLPFFSPQKQ
jgi:hypothetical protein